MSRFLNEKYKTLESYTPGEQPQDMKYVKLNTNESPFPPPPQVVQAITREEVEKLRLYPDPECRRLKEKLSCLYGVSPENIYLSNGSDDILNFAFMAFSGSGPVRFPQISYGFYQVFADLNQVSYQKIPLKDDFTIDPRDYFHSQGMVVIANPNAPTGLALTPEEIQEILEANPDQVVLIDEAYVDFGGETCLPLIQHFENLLVVQTFSKSRSMAGARLGFAIGNEALIGDLERIRYSTNPYNINRLTMAAAMAAVDANDYYLEKSQEIQKTRQYTSDALKRLGFTVLPSLANFLFVKSDRIGGVELYQRLKEQGVLIRHFTAEEIKDYNRITIGTRKDMDILLKKIQNILEEEKKAPASVPAPL